MDKKLNDEILSYDSQNEMKSRTYDRIEIIRC